MTKSSGFFVWNLIHRRIRILDNPVTCFVCHFVRRQVVEEIGMVRWERESGLTEERSSTLLGNGDILRSKVVDSPVISRFRFALKAGYKAGLRG